MGKGSALAGISRFAVSLEAFRELVEKNLPDVDGSVEVNDGEVVLALDGSFLKETVSAEYERGVDSIDIRDDEAEITQSVPGDTVAELVEKNLPDIPTSSDSFSDITKSVGINDGEVVLALDGSFLKETVSAEYERGVDSIDIRDDEVEVNLSEEAEEVEGEVKEEAEEVEGEVKEEAEEVEGEFVCGECGDKFETEGGLKIHKSRVHGKEESEKEREELDELEEDELEEDELEEDELEEDELERKKRERLQYVEEQVS